MTLRVLSRLSGISGDHRGERRITVWGASHAQCANISVDSVDDSEAWSADRHFKRGDSKWGLGWRVLVRILTLAPSRPFQCNKLPSMGTQDLNFCAKPLNPKP